MSHYYKYLYFSLLNYKRWMYSTVDMADTINLRYFVKYSNVLLVYDDDIITNSGIQTELIDRIIFNQRTNQCIYNASYFKKLIFTNFFKGRSYNHFNCNTKIFKDIKLNIKKDAIGLSDNSGIEIMDIMWPLNNEIKDRLVSIMSEVIINHANSL